MCKLYLFCHISFVAVFLCTNRGCFSQKSKIAGTYNKAGNTSRKTSYYTLSLVTVEVYKQLICRKNICIILAAVALQCIASAVYYKPQSNINEILYHINRVKGPVTEDKLKIISDEGEYKSKAISDYEKAKDDYKNGLITQEEYQKYENRYNYAEYVNYAYRRLCERRDYLLTASAKHPGVAFIYDEGLKRFFGVSFDIVSVALILLLGSGIFSLEYELGFHAIMRASKRGRSEIFRAKCVYALMLAIILYAVLTGISLLFSFISMILISGMYRCNACRFLPMSFPIKHYTALCFVACHAPARLYGNFYAFGSSKSAV